MSLIEPPEPGIYRAMPAGQYHAIDAASQSYLKLLAAGDSPFEVRHQMLNPRPSTPATRLGTALHSLMFDDPATFAAKVVLCPPFNKHKPSEREAYAEFVAAHTELTIIDTVAQWDLVHAMAAALHEHPFCRTYLPLITQRELTLIGRHPEHGLPMKARLDAVVESESMILDVKSTLSVNPYFREREVRKRGYLHQGAFYADHARDHGIDARHYCLLWVKNKPPHEVVPARLTDTTLAIGRKGLEKPMAVMAECYRTGEWPQQTATLVDQSLSEWDERSALRDFDLDDWEAA